MKKKHGPRLVRGDRLNAAQRRHVLAAFCHRWTHENRATYGGRCPACAQCGPFPYECGEALPGGAVSYTEAEWHAYHAPLVSDDQWLAQHAFYVKADGQIADKPSRCEPAFMAE